MGYLARLIHMHAADNVAIVANDGGLPAGALARSGLALREKVPQGHKVALVDLAAGDAVRRYGVIIGQPRRPDRGRQLGARAPARHAGGAQLSTTCRSRR